MKKFSTLFIAALLLAGWSSGCADYLNTVPVDKSSPNTFLKGVEQAKSMLAGIYYCFYDDSPAYITPYTYENMCDNSYNHHTWEFSAEFASGTQTAASWWAELKWTKDWQAISRANSLIRSMALATGIGPADSRKILAEARFLRAWFYFDLVRFYGRVPLVDENSPQENAPREGLDKVMAFIKGDVEYAVGNLDNIPAARSPASVGPHAPIADRAVRIRQRRGHRLRQGDQGARIRPLRRLPQAVPRRRHQRPLEQGGDLQGQLRRGPAIELHDPAVVQLVLVQHDARNGQQLLHGQRTARQAARSRQRRLDPRRSDLRQGLSLREPRPAPETLGALPRRRIPLRRHLPLSGPLAARQLGQQDRLRSQKGRQRDAREPQQRRRRQDPDALRRGAAGVGRGRERGERPQGRLRDDRPAAPPRGDGHPHRIAAQPHEGDYAGADPQRTPRGAFPRGPALARHPPLEDRREGDDRRPRPRCIEIAVLPFERRLVALLAVRGDRHRQAFVQQGPRLSGGRFRSKS